MPIRPNHCSHHRSLITATLLGLVVMATTSTRVAAQQGDAAVDADADAALADQIARLAAEALDTPVGAGLSIAVARDGKVLHAAGYGLAEIEHGIATTQDTPFRIGSITKQFSAAAIMQLIEQGKLSLDDTLDQFFPEFDTQGHTVTLEQLLNHTSGIPSYTSSDKFWEVVAKELTIEELFDTVAEQEFDFAPGERWSYNNTAYYMLGPIIEQASGVPYCEYIDDMFFSTLRLTQTRCDSNAAIIPGRAQGYGVNDGVLVNDDLLGMENPGAAGMLMSTAHDLVRWKMALMAGAVVSSASVELMTTPHTLPDGDSTGYGFGLGIGDFHGHRKISHGGGINGFNAMLEYYPEDDGLCIAVISNSEGVNSARLSQQIARMMLDIKDAVAAALTDDDADRFAGIYAFEEIEFELEIFFEDGKPFARAPGQPTLDLIYQGDRTFVVEQDTSIRIVLDEADDEDGTSPALTLHQNGKHRASRKIDNRP